MRTFNRFKRCACVLILLVSTLISTTIAYAADTFVNKYMPTPVVVGEARLKVMFWNIYDAVLYAPDGDFKQDQAFALSLTYLRDFKGENIASRSIDEMRAQGFSDEVKLAAWFEQMKSVFPNVLEGENITGVRASEGVTHFYKNGQHVGTIEDPEFTAWFFNIWFGDKTSQPDMRDKLLGLSE